jgi:hypothetical protein
MTESRQYDAWRRGLSSYLSGMGLSLDQSSLLVPIRPPFVLGHSLAVAKKGWLRKGDGNWLGMPTPENQPPVGLGPASAPSGPGIGPVGSGIPRLGPAPEYGYPTPENMLVAVVAPNPEVCI